MKHTLSIMKTQKHQVRFSRSRRIIAVFDHETKILHENKLDSEPMYSCPISYNSPFDDIRYYCEAVTVTFLYSMGWVLYCQLPKHLLVYLKLETNMTSIAASQASRSSVKVKEIRFCTGKYTVRCCTYWIKARPSFRASPLHLSSISPAAPCIQLGMFLMKLQTGSHKMLL